MEVYIRLGHRYLGRHRYRTLEVANVSVRRQGQGRFTDFLVALEHFCPVPAIYIECVHDKRFAEFFLKKRYTQVEVPADQPQGMPMSFYKLLNV